MEKTADGLHHIERYRENIRSGEVRHIARIGHSGLNNYRIIRDKEELILNIKIDSQFLKWDEQWGKVIQRKKILTEKKEAIAKKESRQIEAEERTAEAQGKLKEMQNILLHTLTIDHAVDWDKLKNYKHFNIVNPKNLLEGEILKIEEPIYPLYRVHPDEPDVKNFEPKLSIIDKMVQSKRIKKINKSKESYAEAVDFWKELVRDTKNYNDSLNEKYQTLLNENHKQKERILKKYDTLQKEWEKSKSEYYSEQKKYNENIEKLKESYFQKDMTAITEYCELVLNNSEYPESFPMDFDLEYKIESKLLVIDYALPAPGHLSTLSEVKYFPTKDEFKEYSISDSQFSKLYEMVVYNICLRTIHEIFESDKSDAIDIVVFNGWVESMNRAIGKNVNSCIVSLQAKKDEFVQINLENVDAKACFKNLKGVSGSKLIGISAVNPILQMDKNDRRFVSSYDVVSKIDGGYNLAIMDWEDFEHLIREIFEKEFSVSGGEVKVTQASRDGGVDAVAFDPDPIRGGKIVIQAKRYTNTVGVAAVRDLYGTVMNEGANRGILVSTADYGPDAYEFVKNKPLTLMNGANLLSLLEKHGQKARIDLAEAKKNRGSRS